MAIIDHIEVPDPDETYLVLTKGGYYKALLSLAPGYDYDSRTAFVLDTRQTYLFQMPSYEFLEDAYDSDVSVQVKALPEQVDSLVALMAVTNGIDSRDLEPFHISQLEKYTGHKYDESSEFYPQDVEEEPTTDEGETE